MQPTRVVSTPGGLADIFAPQAILIGLTQRTKQGVVEELVHHLADRGAIAAREEKAVVESILAREKIGSTALGNGIALPHCRCSLTEKFVGVLGLEPRGVPFDAIDGEPVQGIFLLLAPLEGRERHYELLGKILAIGRDKSRRAQLRGCQSAAAVHEFLQELDRC